MIADDGEVGAEACWIHWMISLLYERTCVTPVQFKRISPV